MKLPRIRYEPDTDQLADSAPEVPRRDSQVPAEALLHELVAAAGISAYRVDASQAGEVWRVSAIHCADNGFWKLFNVTVDADALGEASVDAHACRALIVRLATSLAPCDRG